MNRLVIIRIVVLVGNLLISFVFGVRFVVIWVIFRIIFNLIDMILSG